MERTSIAFCGCAPSRSWHRRTGLAGATRGRLVLVEGMAKERENDVKLEAIFELSEPHNPHRTDGRDQGRTGFEIPSAPRVDGIRSSVRRPPLGRLPQLAGAPPRLGRQLCLLESSPPLLKHASTMVSVPLALLV